VVAVARVLVMGLTAVRVAEDTATVVGEKVVGFLAKVTTAARATGTPSLAISLVVVGEKVAQALMLRLLVRGLGGLMAPTTTQMVMLQEPQMVYIVFPKEVRQETLVPELRGVRVLATEEAAEAVKDHGEDSLETVGA
tara:strand:+ start:659 stop:1072 length:414 start_codon:yes stop_codon:yes gene_type:complete